MIPYRPSDILGMGHTVEVCSMLHDVVLEFRQAHGSAMNDGTSGRQDPVENYPLVTAPLEQVAAIAHLSDPPNYAAIRHGGRFQSPYPPLGDESLQACCRELRAALVWKSRVSGDRINGQ